MHPAAKTQDWIKRSYFQLRKKTAELPWTMLKKTPDFCSGLPVSPHLHNTNLSYRPRRTTAHLNALMSEGRGFPWGNKAMEISMSQMDKTLIFKTPERLQSQLLGTHIKSHSPVPNNWLRDEVQFTRPHVSHCQPPPGFSSRRAFSKRVSYTHQTWNFAPFFFSYNEQK